MECCHEIVKFLHEQHLSFKLIKIQVKPYPGTTDGNYMYYFSNFNTCSQHEVLDILENV